MNHCRSLLSKKVLAFLAISVVLLAILTCLPIPLLHAAGTAGDVEKPMIYDGYGTSVYALKPSDGTVVWKKTFDAQVGGNVVNANDRLFVPLQSGEIVAISAENGQILWHVKLVDTAVTGQFLAPTLAFDRGMLVAGTSDGYLHALDSENGSVRWNTQLPSCISTANVQNASQLASSYQRLQQMQQVVVPGALTQHIEQPSGTDGCDIIPVKRIGDVVYAFGGFTGGLYAVNMLNGIIIWHNAALFFTNYSLEVVDGHVYVPSSSGGIAILGASDGKLLQMLPPTNPGVVYFAPFVALHNHLYALEAGASETTLTAYLLNQGAATQLWHEILPVGDVFLNGLSASNGSIYAAGAFEDIVSGSQDTDLYAFSPDNGVQQWHWHLNVAEAIAAPTLEFSVVYFSTASGNDAGPYALNPQTGNVLWHSSWETLSMQ